MSLNFLSDHDQSSQFDYNRLPEVSEVVIVINAQSRRRSRTALLVLLSNDENDLESLSELTLVTVLDLPDLLPSSLRGCSWVERKSQQRNRTVHLLLTV